MTDIPDDNEDQSGKTHASRFAQYDFKEACRVLEKLGEGLTGAIKSAKNRFKPEWIEQLVQRYSLSPGKFLVHLSDLHDSVMPLLASEARGSIQPSWDRLGELKGFRWTWHNFRGIVDFLRQGSPRLTTLGTWKKFAELTGTSGSMTLNPS
jgi:hypothetical protein